MQAYVYVLAAGAVLLVTVVLVAMAYRRFAPADQAKAVRDNLIASIPVWLFLAGWVVVSMARGRPAETGSVLAWWIAALVASIALGAWLRRR